MMNDPKVIEIKTTTTTTMKRNVENRKTQMILFKKEVESVTNRLDEAKEKTIRDGEQVDEMES